MTKRLLEFSFAKSFLAPEETLRAHGHFDFEAHPIQAIMGDSGAGKTSLARYLAGLAGGQGYVRWNREDLPTVGRRVGLLAQGDALFPHLTVRANIAYGLRRLEFKARELRVAEMTKMAGLEALLEKFPASLSGGEKRRAALAQALAVRPRLLLLDEPFTGLDRAGKRALWAQTKAAIEEAEVPTVLITHDKEEAAALASKISRYDGRTLRLD